MGDLSWTTACPDWEKRIVAGDSLLPCQPLFADYAEYSMSRFNELKVCDMIGKPTYGEVNRAWLSDFARVIFGSYDFETKQRLIKTFYLLISKKNFKSGLAAGLMLTLLRLNERHNAEFLILAPTKNVADNSFSPAEEMIKADPVLRKIMHVRSRERIIEHRPTGSKLSVVAADQKSAAGSKAGVVLIEEHHLFGKISDARGIITEATGGMAARPEGCLIYLTTQSSPEGPAGHFKEKLDYARAVRDGEVSDPEFLPLLYEFPEQMLKQQTYLEPENWYITNPNLGASVSKSFLRTKLTEAKLVGAEALQDICAKHLNVPIQMSLREERWNAADIWEECSGGFSGLSDLVAQAETLTMGFDGGGDYDLMGFAVCGRRADGSLMLWNHAMCFRKLLEHTSNKQYAPKIEDCADESEVTIIDQMDQQTYSEELGRFCSVLVAELYLVLKPAITSKNLVMVAMDNDRRQTFFESILEPLGMPENLIQPCKQGGWLNPHLVITEYYLGSGKLKHAGQSLMTWCVGNTIAKVRDTSTMLSKTASGAKIDPVIATVMAVGEMVRSAKKPKNMDAFLNDPIFA